MLYIDIALATILNAIALSILGVAVQSLLVRAGFVRGDTFGVVIGCFLLGLVMGLADIGRAHLLFWLALGVLVPLGMNRLDFFTSLTKGRWWWRSN
jgi:hypothetical protein